MLTSKAVILTMARAFAITLLLLTMTSTGYAQDAGAVPGEVLVGPVDRQVDANVRALGLEILERDAYSDVLRVAVPPGTEAEWIARFAAREDVAFAERNSIGMGGTLPDDSYFGRQWHLRNTGQDGGIAGADIDAVSAWDVTTGSPNVVIAVLDTGIDSDHPEFAGRIDPDGYDFVNGDADPEADHWHGSAVAGMLGANGNNGTCVAGVDWQCKILPIKVLDASNRGTTFDLAQGLNYAATQADVDVISMSIIDQPASATLTNALQTARTAGKILIACAGNRSFGDADRSYPGASPLTISVGASTRHDSRAYFSATGAALDVVAPGLDVFTVQHGVSTNTAYLGRGCSLATPIVAGITGLLLAHAESHGLAPLSQPDVLALLAAGAEDQVGPPSEDTPGRDDYFGYGRVNARTSLDALMTIGPCERGNVAAGTGGPIDVVRIDGAATDRGARRFALGVGVPFTLGVDAPPGISAPSFALLGTDVVPGRGDAVALPLGIGDLCFTPSFVAVAGTAPWSETIPALRVPLQITLQGLIFDTPQLDHVAVSNLVLADVRLLPPPRIFSVTPRAAPPGEAVLIRGFGFEPGMTLTVGGQPVVPTTLRRAEVRFTVPATAKCDLGISVINPDGQSDATWFNRSPVLSSLFPSQGPAAGGSQLVIVGTDFTGGSTVTVGGSPLIGAVISQTSIRGTTPPGLAGPASVVVTTPLGCAGVGTYWYVH